MAADRPGQTGPGRLDGLVASAAARCPERVALVDGDRRLTYAELDAAVDRAAGALRALGCAPGTVVGVAALSHPDFAVAYYGAARAGLVSAVLNPYLPEDNLRHVLATSGAEVAAVDAGLLARLAGVRGQLPRLRHVVLIGPSEAAGDTPTLADLLDGQRGAPAPADVAADDVACIQFTSGTTGRPKAVQLTHGNLTVNARQIATAHLLGPGSVAVNHLPTFHPMHLNSSVQAGATHVLCTSPGGTDLVAAAAAHRATHLYSLPVRLARLAADDQVADGSLPTVQWIASGGSALPAGTAATLTRRFGARVFQGYGLAETSPLTHSDDPDAPVHGSVGRPVPGTRCRVVDVTTRRVLPVGEVGEVQLRGPQLMKGYLGGPEGAGIGPDGWFDTGDAGRVDAEDRLFLVDRLKDTFKCDNFLVAPSEVEAVLTALPGVREAVVVDLPDAEHGAVGGALLVLTDPADLDRLVRQANDRMPYYQHVRHAVAVDAIARSANGKLVRRALRDELLDRLPAA